MGHSALLFPPPSAHCDAAVGEGRPTICGYPKPDPTSRSVQSHWPNSVARGGTHRSSRKRTGASFLPDVFPS